MTLTVNTTLPDTLKELLRSHAPGATLLACVGKETFSLGADSPVASAADLTPPDEWFESGELVWITRDGALLGLLWSAQVVPEGTVQMLTLLLAAAQNDTARREADVLITQLPEGAAWLSEDLVFMQVSRRFLELHHLNTAQIIGKPYSTVFPLREVTGQLLAQAAAGRAVFQDRELLVTPAPQRPTWLRSQMRPYYGGAAAGVLWTMQDISQEVSLAYRVQALLLGARLPTAVLSASGEVLERSESLRLKVPDASEAPSHLLWSWPIWHDSAHAEAQLKAALEQALAAPQQRFERRLQVQGGQDATVSLRWGEEPGGPTEPGNALLVAEFSFEQGPGAGAAQNSLLAGVIAHSPQATLLLGSADDSGERPLWLASEAAARLLGVESAALNVPGAAPLSSVLKSLGVQLSRPDLSPLSTITLTTQASLDEAELAAVLTRPDGLRRHLQITAARLASGDGAGRRDEALALYLHDVTAVRHLENRLKHDAGHDPLTGLPNWTGLRARLSAAEGSAATSATELSLLALSLDDFSVLQAALGRQAGDHLLIQVAARLHHWRKDTQVARLEGEEFVLVMPGVNMAAALERAREVQHLMTAPLKVSGREMLVSASVGVACGASGADTLLEQSRTALLAAARTGRAGRAAYTPGLMSREAGMIELEHDLHAAVPGQFTLLFQPMVNFESGRVQGAEVLLRWQHPTRGLLTPGQFLPLAARAGLLPTLGRWVVAQVSAQRSEWQRLHAKLRLSINLSAPELLDPDFLAHIGEQVRLVGGLDIELSAASLIGQNASEHTAAALRELRDLGAQVWVDDFGDGASSLTALERFALSGVKLHPSFVANVLAGPRPLALLEGTVQLARKLNLHVIAVGVETQTQAAVLHAAGCHAAQGFLYSPPMALAEFERWLGTQVLD
ncbi:EAL domain-containing protein [Deinococcus sp.]|uniref:sensor domain-containing protein n=1 Tax=Deinococcus sp. TaxID=47478 RepID=UPI0025E5D42D|nr:EAL domain-containing protein [Deinococcus sp.]